MKIKTSELIGPQLDWVVEMALHPENKGMSPTHIRREVFGEVVDFLIGEYSTDWARGGPVIAHEGIEVLRGNPVYFPKGDADGNYWQPLHIAGKEHGQTQLIAAMRHLVRMKLGDEIEIPQELCQ